MRGMKWARHVAYIFEMKALTGKLKGKRPLGKPRSTWEDDVKWILRNRMRVCNRLMWLR
jgi:hypothetical protein